jgi:hypothetical protein
MRFAGMWSIVVSGLLAIGFLAGAIKGTVPWYAVPFALLLMASGAGIRWLANFIERELSDWGGP